MDEISKRRPKGLPKGYHILEHGERGFVLCDDAQSDDELPVFPTVEDCINHARWRDGLRLTVL